MSFPAIEKLGDKFKIVVSLASLQDEENSFELYRLLPQELEKDLVEATQKILSLPQKERKRWVAQTLQELTPKETASSLENIDAGWILETLRHESPLLLGVILKNLPSREVNFILENLSSEVREKIPNSDAYETVSADLLEWVQKKFQSHFPSAILGSSVKASLFYPFYTFEVEQLLEFFRELGVEQLVKAFQGIHKSALKALIHRLSIKDAKEFQMRIKKMEKVSARELQEAQMLLLSLPMDIIDPESLFLEVGISFFSQALGKEDCEFVCALQYKLPPKIGYLLKRYVDESLAKKNSKLTEWAKKKVLQKLEK